MTSFNHNYSYDTDMVIVATQQQIDQHGLLDGSTAPDRHLV